jgi:superfamily II DNA or RNA helicase|tara:strand:+ start:173 stop:1654 length:1482 start_codon:yes stop_codon:yes gene_type:complete
VAEVFISKKNENEIHIDCEQHVLYELQEAFSFDVEGASFSPAYRKKFWDGKVRLCSVVKQTLPAGLTYRLCKWLDKHDYKWDFRESKYYGVPYEVDERIFYEGVELFMNKISGVKPRDYQIETVFHALKEYRKTIVSPTGSGKSLMIYSIARYLKSIGKRVLVVVPSKGLVEQMTGDFVDYGWDVENIHKIYQGHSIDTKAPVTVTTWQSVYGLDKSWFRQFDGVIGDECHNFKAKCLQGIMKKMPDAKWRYGFTGTLDGKNVHKLILEGQFGPVYRTTTSSDLMDKGFLAQLKVEIITLKHEPQSFKTYNDEIELIGLMEERNRFITNLSCDLKGNVLVLFSRVEKHGLPLHEMIQSKTNRPVHLIYGDTKVDVREDVRSIAEKSNDNLILGSYGTMSTGVNIKNLHHVVFASPSKSRIRVLQSIGRGLRKAKGKESVLLYDIADDFRGGKIVKNNFTLNHLAERIKFYIDEDFTYRITELTLNKGVGRLDI